WNNVVRWELRPRIFLRTTEFLWQEGHTAHATREDAAAYAERILREVYEDFMVDVLAVPVLVGRKTASERFAGAINTLTCEGMMRDGKALQMGTSHELGQNFAKAFEIDYLDATGATQLCWTTSWGASTRLVGGLIMTHGDDAGLVVPPRVAPIQAVVLLVKAADGAAEAATAVTGALAGAGLRVRLDDQVATSFGRRATDWELKGVPVRVEVGPRDVAEGVVTLVRRDLGGDDPARKSTVGLGGGVDAVAAGLDAAQASLWSQATARLEGRITDVVTLDEAAEAAADGFARIPWAAVGEEG